jgi:hypothetical protein
MSSRSQGGIPASNSLSNLRSMFDKSPRKISAPKQYQKPNINSGERPLAGADGKQVGINIIDLQNNNQRCSFTGKSSLNNGSTHSYSLRHDDSDDEFFTSHQESFSIHSSANSSPVLTTMKSLRGSTSNGGSSNKSQGTKALNAESGPRRRSPPISPKHRRDASEQTSPTKHHHRSPPISPATTRKRHGSTGDQQKVEPSSGGSPRGRATERSVPKLSPRVLSPPPDQFCRDYNADSYDASYESTGHMSHSLFEVESDDSEQDSVNELLNGKKSSPVAHQRTKSLTSFTVPALDATTPPKQRMRKTKQHLKNGNKRYDDDIGVSSVPRPNHTLLDGSMLPCPPKRTSLVSKAAAPRASILRRKQTEKAQRPPPSPTASSEDGSSDDSSSRAKQSNAPNSHAYHGTDSIRGNLNHLRMRRSIRLGTGPVRIPVIEDTRAQDLARLQDLERQLQVVREKQTEELRAIADGLASFQDACAKELQETKAAKSIVKVSRAPLEEHKKQADQLRKENEKIREHNAAIRTSCNNLRINNERLADKTDESSDLFLSLEEHHKRVKGDNSKLMDTHNEIKREVVELEEALEAVTNQFRYEHASRTIYEAKCVEFAEMVRYYERDNKELGALVASYMKVMDDMQAEWTHSTVDRAAIKKNVRSQRKKSMRETL